MKITTEQLAAYFESKGAKGDCPVCNTDNWAVTPVAGPDGEFQAGEIALEVSAQMVRSHSWVPVLPVVCQNCGFLRMHHTFWIQKWLGEQGNGGE